MNAHTENGLMALLLSTMLVLVIGTGVTARLADLPEARASAQAPLQAKAAAQQPPLQVASR